MDRRRLFPFPSLPPLSVHIQLTTLPPPFLQVYTLQYVKLAISVVKYVPQAWLNHTRRATVGWAIENTLLDCAGGVLSLAQLVLDSSLQGNHPPGSE